MEIIGVVGHVRQSSLAEPGREQIYFTDGYGGPGGVVSWALRVPGDPSGYASQVRAAIKDVSPRLLITDLQPVDELVEGAQSQTTFFSATDRRLRGHRRSAGRGWTLRRAFDRRAATYPRDRRAHGPRRRAPKHLPPYRRAGTSFECNRSGHWRRCRSAAYAAHDEDARRREAHRSRHVRVHDAALFRDRNRILMDSRTPGSGSRPEQGTERGIDSPGRVRSSLVGVGRGGRVLWCGHTADPSLRSG